jgi:hypothetical protein
MTENLVIGTPLMFTTKDRHAGPIFPFRKPPEQTAGEIFVEWTSLQID